MNDHKVFPITYYPWGDGNEDRPEAWAEMRLDGTSLLVCLRCRQNDPRCVVTEIGGPVCTDDCLEFFLRPDPARLLYFNFEVNAAGVYHLGLGEGRHGRRVFDSLPDGFAFEPFRTGTEWGVDIRIDPVFFETCFACLPSRHMYGNFYKCGDKTKSPHWGMWKPYDLSAPDFHRPELFGSIDL